MKNIRIGILTSSELPQLVSDDQLLLKEMQSQGWVCEPVIWDEIGSWSHYDYAIIRNTWDYYKKIDHFLAKLEEENSNTMILNPLQFVKWNLNKKYIFDLEKKGIRIIPTNLVDMADRNAALNMVLKLSHQTMVIKPLVGVNAHKTFKVVKEEFIDRIDYFQTECANQEMLVQPFLETIVTEGEMSFVFFGNKFSHALIKNPKTGDFRVQEDHGGTTQFIEASMDEISQAKNIIDKVGNLLYARVDMVRGDDGKMSLMELEITEPHLYFSHYPKSVELFTETLRRWIK